MTTEEKTCHGILAKGIKYPRLDPIRDAQHHVRLKKDKALCVWRYIGPIKGRGVFALEPILKGSFILEYRGVLEKTAAWNEYTYFFKHKRTDYCIDASREDGTLGRLVNDAEKPNAKMKKIEVDVCVCLPSLTLRKGKKLPMTTEEKTCHGVLAKGIKVVYQSSLHLQATHQSSVHLQATHQSSLHLQATHQSSLHLQATHQSSLHLQATHQSFLHLQATHQSSLHLQATHQSSLHLQATHQSSLHLQATHQSSLHLQATHQSSLHLQVTHHFSPPQCSLKSDFVSALALLTTDAIVYTVDQLLALHNTVVLPQDRLISLRDIN
ncbi:Histone-lysine N-methyltransferase set-1 [Merluccius polli]|uniref:Histone-lysine N-methyltransferase set-1 n=1 Tax=Merluccius polli TaxID=89951 RepID=A0AA47MQ84_MERPO|nr:Histone-lysine N-methyltransferase set-1 [Merluccius polli]